MKANEVREAAVEVFAANSHNAWRRRFHRSNPDQKTRPRLRLRGGEMVDVNQPWSRLHPKAKADNRLAGYDALDAVAQHPRDREAAAAHVHACWVRRNRRDPNQPKELFRPYSQLPEIEKDKDRAHIDAIKAALAAVRRRASGGAKRTGKRPHLGKTHPNSIQRSGAAIRVDEKTWRRLESVCSRLSARLGRQVSVQNVALAGLRSTIASYEALCRGDKA